MRKLLRILLRCVGVVVALCLVLAGVIAYNRNRYKMPGENPRDSSVVAQQGDVETGLVFSGNNMRKVDSILPVKEIFARLVSEAAAID